MSALRKTPHDGLPQGSGGEAGEADGDGCDAVLLDEGVHH